MKLNPRTLTQIDSPIGVALSLVAKRAGHKTLLNMSQAAPSHPPAPVVVEHITEVARSQAGAQYCPQEGLPELRKVFAAELRRDHNTEGVSTEDLLITAGCNQAFCVTTSALASPRDEALMQDPFYFNHDMWLRLDGVVPVAVSAPHTADHFDAAITERTRFMVVVSPGNPTGVTLDPAELDSLADLAQRRGIVLILDETYRSFRPTEAPSHSLYSRPDWRSHVVTLHSFSKDLALPGYRVGAVVGSPALLAEIMKLLDCIAICAPRIGQEAAIAGLLHASQWRAEQRRQVLDRQQVFVDLMAQAPGGFELVSAGAYFGWVRAPAHLGGAVAAVEQLIIKHDVLAIPGSAFTEGDTSMVRFSFANLEPDLLSQLPDRLAATQT